MPDLPGHGATPAPRHGAYDPMGPVTLARWALGGRRASLVGVGQNAHGALILAAGGGCDAVAIVDGLWGPWPTADDAVDAMYAGAPRDRSTTTAPTGAAAGVGPRPADDARLRRHACRRRSPQRFWGAVDLSRARHRDARVGDAAGGARRAPRAGSAARRRSSSSTTATPAAIVAAVAGLAPRPDASERWMPSEGER